MKRKTLIPNDFRDFLSIISFIGFTAIALTFLGKITWLEENLTGFFLLTMGIAFVVIGNLFTIKKWIKDGIQGGEVIKIFAILVGFLAIVMGILLIVNVNIPTIFAGVVGFISLTAGVFIVIDYFTKNN